MEEKSDESIDKIILNRLRYFNTPTKHITTILLVLWRVKMFPLKRVKGGNFEDFYINPYFEDKW